MIRQRGEGSWEFYVDLPRLADGKRRRKHVTVKGTKKEAEAKRLQMLAELDAGTYGLKITFGAFLHQWLQEAKGRLSSEALAEYSAIVREHLVPAFGNLEVGKVSPFLIVQYYHAKLHKRRGGLQLEDTGRDGRPETGELTREELQRHHVLLLLVFSDALVKRLIADNPIDHVDPPMSADVDGGVA